LLVFLVATLLAAALTPQVRRFARRHGLLDHAPESRRPDGKPVPRLGGMAMAVGCYVPVLSVLLLRWCMGQSQDRLFWTLAILLGGLATILLGLYDDLRGATAVEKLTVQIAVATALCTAGLRIEQVAIPSGGTVSLGVLAVPVTVLWIVGLTNAINLVDGLDGLAGGVALVAITVAFMVASSRGDVSAMLLMAGMGGAIAGFLFFNFSPASIFMGDSGSLFLGYMLSATAIASPQDAPAGGVDLLVPLVALGFPVADTLLAVVRRTAAGQSLLKGDRDHIHHRLLQLGLTERQTVVILYAVSALFGLAALVLAFGDRAHAALALAVVMVGVLVGLRRLGYFRADRTMRAPPAPTIAEGEVVARR
jgi:UDP-GlcNAc:undecaprenyl-phosphate GlcNAc-1-phosphate transferase